MSDVSQSEWMSIFIEVPEHLGRDLLKGFESHGFKDVDFCEMERRDGGRLTFGPCAPRPLEYPEVFKHD